MLAKSRNYWLHPKYIFEQAFYRLILLIQENEKITFYQWHSPIWISNSAQEHKKVHIAWMAFWPFHELLLSTMYFYLERSTEWFWMWLVVFCRCDHIFVLPDWKLHYRSHIDIDRVYYCRKFSNRCALLYWLWLNCGTKIFHYTRKHLATHFHSF